MGDVALAALFLILVACIAAVTGHWVLLVVAIIIAVVAVVAWRRHKYIHTPKAVDADQAFKDEGEAASQGIPYVAAPPLWHD